MVRSSVGDTYVVWNLATPFHAILDELPSTAPLPTLRTRMANERALGISFLWAAQAWPQLSAIFGDQEARTLLSLTNALVLFGGSKDVAFNREISDLLGQVRVTRSNYQTGRMGGRQYTADDIPILTHEQPDTAWLAGTALQVRFSHGTRSPDLFRAITMHLAALRDEAPDVIDGAGHALLHTPDAAAEYILRWSG